MPLESSGSSRSAGPAAVRTRSHARRCSRNARSPPRPSRASLRARPPASTGWPGWERRTSRSSAPPNRASSRSRRFLRAEREGILAAGGPEIQESLGQLLSDVDRDAATGEFAEYLATLFHGGLETDIWGWFDDDLAFVADWGFSLQEIRTPVAVWQGSEDRMVPYGHGRWLAENVAGAQPHLLDGEGHLSILLGAYGRLLDDLLTLGG